MTYERLAGFVQNRMRMSHVYQPVMLTTLLRGGGRASTWDIARAILAHDESQVEYYEDVTKNMVGRVLRKHDIVEKEGDGYSLVGYEDLGEEEIEYLIELCEAKLESTRPSAASASGSTGGVLCGVSADVRALEVDHIVPRSRGGKDDPDNLQALCYSCNSMKRDRDATDFRQVRESYGHRQPGCPFCEMPADSVVRENELAYAVRDAFPVTPLHTLVIPKRHVRGYFELGRPELNACHRLLEREKETIEEQDDSVKGFNVGVNNGELAGQTIFHCHVHLIPRRKGDVEDPTGGVRNVIPGKGDYRHQERRNQT